MSQQINDCDTNTKALYKLVSGLTSSKSSNPLPDPTTESIAEEFVDKFIDKMDKIWVIWINMINITLHTGHWNRHYPTLNQWQMNMF